MPGYNRHDLTRTTLTYHFNPGHEQLVRNMDDPSYRAAVVEKRDSGMFPRCYYEHPIVLGAAIGALVGAVGLFVDAVPYSLTDSAIGFWLFDLVTQQRFLMGVLRKRYVCKCGCRGWCSFYEAWTLVHWTLYCAAHGIYARARHDLKAWRPSDAWRMSKAGQSLAMLHACCFVCVDWAEVASTLGFPSWSSGMRPCFKCNGFGDLLYSLAGHNLRSLSWRPNSDDDYEQACLRCEIPVTLDARLRDIICARLKYDRRQDGARGLALVANVPEVALRSGDRLEPSPCMRDVARIFDIDLGGRPQCCHCLLAPRRRNSDPPS